MLPFGCLSLSGMYLSKRHTNQPHVVVSVDSMHMAPGFFVPDQQLACLKLSLARNEANIPAPQKGESLIVNIF